jgi:hypothetical protein
MVDIGHVHSITYKHDDTDVDLCSVGSGKVLYSIRFHECAAAFADGE